MGREGFPVRQTQRDLILAGLSARQHGRDMAESPAPAAPEGSPFTHRLSPATPDAPTASHLVSGACQPVLPATPDAAPATQIASGAPQPVLPADLPAAAGAAEEKPAGFRAEAVFAALADGRRRKILEHLFTKGECSAAQLRGGVGRTRSVVGKHLATLCEAGLVVPAGVDPRDSRHRLYALAPALRAQGAARGELDFGCGVLRFCR